MAGKKFKFRSDGNRRVGIKEVVTRGISVKGPKVSVSVGLDSNFNLSEVHIVEDNILKPISAVKDIKKIKGVKGKYYPIDSISYIATITLQYNGNNKLVDKLLTVYIPSNICSSEELYCNRATSLLTKEQKEHILNNITGYATKKV